MSNSHQGITDHYRFIIVIGIAIVCIFSLEYPHASSFLKIFYLSLIIYILESKAKSRFCIITDFNIKLVPIYCSDV